MSSTIILTVLLVSIPSVLLGAYVTLADRCRRRTPPELRGDWWAQFEREFRAYAERARTGLPTARANPSTGATATGGLRQNDLSTVTTVDTPAAIAF